MLVVQNAANPSVVLDAIVDSAPASCTKLFVASAYVTREGTRLLFDRLRHKLGAVAFGNLSKRLVTTFDYGLTEPDAIQDWEAEGAKVWIANAGVIQAGTSTRLPPITRRSIATERLPALGRLYPDRPISPVGA